MKQRERMRLPSRHSPDLVLAYLQYAVDDVREYSERSAQRLEVAIRALAEDTRSISIKETTTRIWPS